MCDSQPLSSSPADSEEGGGERSRKEGGGELRGAGGGGQALHAQTEEGVCRSEAALLCAEGGDEEAERQLRGPRYLYTPPILKDVVVLVFVSHPILSCRLLSTVCDSAGPWL